MANKTFIQEGLNYIKKGKEGALIGGLLGLGAAFSLGALGADLNFALQSAGLVDSLVSVGTTSAQLAQTKVGLALTMIGSTAGTIIWNEVK
jgi:hypothetical protein